MAQKKDFPRRRVVDIDPEPSSSEEEEDDERRMREELSEVPLGELQQVRDKVGSKKFDVVLRRKSTLGGEGNFKRPNKNRPSEMSSKKRVSRFRHVVNVKKKEKGRDPRFDDRCGKLNQDLFEKSYAFVDEIKQEEKEIMGKELKQTKNVQKKEKIKGLLQRMESREASKQVMKERKALDTEHRKVERTLAKEGKRPFFIGSSLRKKIALVEKYKSLQDSGQLKKFLSKKRKRNAAKDRRKLPDHRPISFLDHETEH